MLDLSINPEALDHAVARAKERGIILPTFAQMADPSRIPESIRARLANVGLWDIDPANLFRITWQNAPQPHGGGYGQVNALEFPSSLTGTPARIIALVGKWFPTGAHKVGATAGCLLPAMVTGQFDPTRQFAAWPSTGNFCRGGAYNATLLGCRSIAILPQGMSRERFEWLSKLDTEVIATPGSESNVKEIFDKCWELRSTRPDVVIFNQFEQMGNYLWHYHVTGRAMRQVLERRLGPQDTFRGIAVTTGSAGTLASGDYLKTLFPTAKIAASEALQCPTLLKAGFGEHRIEGIGDKHVPWIHNVRNTDLVMAIDDDAAIALVRLFNEEAGRAYLVQRGVPEATVDQLSLLGISGIANLLSSIKLAKWYEMDDHDVVLTVLTDSMDLYHSRVAELRQKHGPYDELDAAADFHRHLLGCDTAHVRELDHPAKQAIHNLKYYTWVEQQARTSDELRAQWHDRDHWTATAKQVDEIDSLIEQFNRRTGLAGNS
ncbi:MAG: pyridoxal-phosphate dependent enzyme [Phycisphaeraceae bacterium]|nr:pyridoxal-phosphate dependent enzyme [Phycisphaeraceae bacterium]